MAHAPSSNKQDYFVNEPALGNINSSETPALILPVQFFQRKGELYAFVHCLSLSKSGDGFIIETSYSDDLLELLVLFMARLGAVSRLSQLFLSQPKPAETQLVLSVSTQAGLVQLWLEQFRANKISYFGQQHAT